MTNKANATQRHSLIEMILGDTPYLPQSAKYQILEKDLGKLQWDTLLILRQSQKMFLVSKLWVLLQEIQQQKFLSLKKA